MNLKEVQNTLMEYYSRPHSNGKVRHIVFWYDEAREFREEISNLDLENVKILEVTKDNLFATKYEIEKVHPNSNFLLYAPMAKPSPREDWLLDTYKFSFEFATDKVTIIMRDLGVEDDDLLRITFKKYSKFFNSKERYNLFASYNIEKYSEQMVDLAVLSALCKCPYVSLEEVLKILFIEECNETNKYWDSIIKFSDEDTFWALVERVFGYQDSEKTLFNLYTFLCITHASEGLRIDVPATWQPFVARQITNSVVFIDHFKANKDEFQQLSDKVALKIDVAKYCSGWEMESYLACDTFKQFDLQIIEKLSKLLSDGLQEFQSYKEVVNQRRKSHWYSNYKYEISALYWAIILLEKVKDLSQTIKYDNAEVMFRTYVKEYSIIDQAYRKFYVGLDQVKNLDKLFGLRDYVENVYTNWYLNYLSIQWSKAIENNTNNQWPLMDITQQNHFYRDSIRSHVNKNERVFVIISDALRYEAGKELGDLLNVERRGSTEIHAMQTVLPSYTDLGMAALLPHKELSIVDGQVVIDGYKASSTENRNAVLNKYVGDAIAITYKNMIGWTRQQYREHFTGKKVIYIYHNSIDAQGESANSEHKVFDAVEDTFSELLSLVNNLVNHISASMIYITADHGFLYQRSSLEQHDKVISTSQDAILFNRRFIVANKKEKTQGTLTFSMSSTQSDQGELFVTVPRGAERFVKQGGGSNYVHGGAMLQEIVVPLIKFKNDRSKNSQNVIKKVDVQLTSLTRKITNNITYLEFFQSEKVEEKKVPLRLKLYIADEAGIRVSNENIIIADKRSERPEDRTFREKFVLKSTTYDKTKRYFLVLEDEEENVENIYEKYPFTIDISFGNDFGF